MAKSNAHHEARCPSCGRTHSWNGSIEDRPACPYCEYRLPEKERKEAQRKFDELVAQTKKRVVERKPKTPRKRAKRKTAARRKRR